MERIKKTRRVLFDRKIPARNIDAINRMISCMQSTEMQAAVALLRHAKRICVVATGHSRSAGVYCHFLLSDICNDVSLIQQYTDVDEGELRRFDLVFAIGDVDDSDYQEMTGNILRYLRKLEIPIIYIAEGLSSGENGNSTVTLRVSDESDFYSPVPTLTVLEMLFSGLKEPLAS